MLRTTMARTTQHYRYYFCYDHHKYDHHILHYDFRGWYGDD